MLILQFVTYEPDDGDGPTPVEFAEEVEELATTTLAAANLGACDGFDLGNGKTNVFCSVTDPQRACDLLVAALEKTGTFDQVVAYVDDDRAADEDPRVLWPTDFAGTFSVL